MMTCEFIQEELVAYRDGELPAQDRERIAAHLETCEACAREEAQLAQVERLLARLERLEPSPEFSANFWKRLEQEQTRGANAEAPSAPPVREHRLVRWWREWRESLQTWQIAPALAAAASLLVCLGYLLTSAPTPTKLARQKPAAPALASASVDAPPGLAEKVDLFANYKVIADLERLSHFEEIAALELPTAHETEVAKEDDLPPELLQNPGFFAHYPMLQRMEQLQSLEAVLDHPAVDEAQRHG